MWNGIFKDRSAKDRAATEEQALAELLAARELRNFPLSRYCEIGPFVVDYLFSERALIVELADAAKALDDSPQGQRQAARLKFLNDMGYAVLALDSRELVRHPRQTLSRVLAALRS